jgi:hypothetical protein
VSVLMTPPSHYLESLQCWLSLLRSYLLLFSSSFDNHLPHSLSLPLPPLNRLPDESKEGRDILNEMPTEAERSSAVEVIPVGLGR